MRNQNAAKKTFKNVSVNSDLCLGPFFPGTSFLILLDTRDTPGSVFFDIVFSFFFFQNRNKTNAMNFKKKKNRNFFTSHIVTEMSEVILFR